MSAGAALALGVVHGLAWLHERRAPGGLVFLIVAFAVAGVALTELQMMNATTPAGWARWVRWFHVPLFFLITGLVLFVRSHLGTGRTWLAGTIVGLRCIVLAGNFTSHPNFNFVEITRLRRLPFLGQEVATVGEAVVAPWQWVATLSVVLFGIYVLDAAVMSWWTGGRDRRRKALVIGCGIVTFVVASIAQTQLVVWGLLKLPVSMTPFFLFTLGAIAIELSRDIATMQMAEAEARRLRDELAHATRVTALGELSGSLAHEINQPLAIILSNAEAARGMLEGGTGDPDELKTILAEIISEDLRAGEVIQRLRALLKRGHARLLPHPPNGVVRDTINLLRNDLAERDVRVQTNLADGLPDVSLDPVQFQQVLMNLITNACDAMAARPPHERTLQIVTSGAPEGVRLSVHDRGCGLPEGDPAVVFQSFYTTKGNGLGIGLSISRSIIAAHQGRIWAERNTHGGATFHVELPAAALSDS